MLEQIRLLARYNQWMNGNLHHAAARLAPERLVLDQGAYFGSILGTLNHLLVGDTIWLRRFGGHPAQFSALDPIRQDTRPLALTEILHKSLEPWWQARASMDSLILRFTAQLTDADLATALKYRNDRGQAFNRRFGNLLLHLFNHQTHHRGQVTTLLFQQGIDPGITDLLAVMPDNEPDRGAAR